MNTIIADLAIISERIAFLLGKQKNGLLKDHINHTLYLIQNDKFTESWVVEDGKQLDILCVRKRKKINDLFNVCTK